MSRYLVVAHQTATSRELRARVRALVLAEPGAEFTLLVPATPVSHLFTWEDDETLDVAQRRAEEARLCLQEARAGYAQRDREPRAYHGDRRRVAGAPGL